MKRNDGRVALARVVRLSYGTLLWLAMGWTIFNCLYVFLIMHGARGYRLESALFVLVLVMLPLLFGKESHSPYSDPH